MDAEQLFPASVVRAMVTEHPNDSESSVAALEAELARMIRRNAELEAEVSALLQKLSSTRLVASESSNSVIEQDIGPWRAVCPANSELSSRLDALRLKELEHLLNVTVSAGGDWLCQSQHAKEQLELAQKMVWEMETSRVAVLAAGRNCNVVNQIVNQSTAGFEAKLIAPQIAGLAPKYSNQEGVRITENEQQMAEEVGLIAQSSNFSCQIHAAQWNTAAMCATAVEASLVAAVEVVEASLAAAFEAMKVTAATSATRGRKAMTAEGLAVRCAAELEASLAAAASPLVVAECQIHESEDMWAETARRMTELEAGLASALAAAEKKARDTKAVQDAAEWRASHLQSRLAAQEDALRREVANWDLASKKWTEIEVGLDGVSALVVAAASAADSACGGWKCEVEVARFATHATKVMCNAIEHRVAEVEINLSSTLEATAAAAVNVATAGTQLQLVKRRAAELEASLAAASSALKVAECQIHESEDMWAETARRMTELEAGLAAAEKKARDTKAVQDAAEWRASHLQSRLAAQEDALRREVANWDLASKKWTEIEVGLVEVSALVVAAASAADSACGGWRGWKCEVETARSAGRMEAIVLEAVERQVAVVDISLASTSAAAVTVAKQATQVRLSMDSAVRRAVELEAGLAASASLRILESRLIHDSEELLADIARKVTELEAGLAMAFGAVVEAAESAETKTRHAKAQQDAAERHAAQLQARLASAATAWTESEQWIQAAEGGWELLERRAEAVEASLAASVEAAAAATVARKAREQCFADLEARMAAVGAGALAAAASREEAERRTAELEASLAAAGGVRDRLEAAHGRFHEELGEAARELEARLGRIESERRREAEAREAEVRDLADALQWSQTESQRLTTKLAASDASQQRSSAAWRLERRGLTDAVRERRAASAGGGRGAGRPMAGGGNLWLGCGR